MGIRKAGSTVRLNEYEDSLLGLMFVRDVEMDTDWGTRQASEAAIVDLEHGRNLGYTIVFQQAIRNELKRAGQDWIYGLLRKQPHDKYEDGSIFVLDAEEVELEDVLDGFQRAGIDVGDDEEE